MEGHLSGLPHGGGSGRGGEEAGAAGPPLERLLRARYRPGSALTAALLELAEDELAEKDRALHGVQLEWCVAVFCWVSVVVFAVFVECYYWQLSAVL